MGRGGGAAGALAAAGAGAERARVLAEHDRRVAHAKAAVAACHEQARVCSDARRELRATAAPELLARVADLDGRRQRVADRIGALRKQVATYRPVAEREVPDLPRFAREKPTGSVWDLDRRDIILRHKEATKAKAAAVFRMSRLTPDLAAAEAEYALLEVESAEAAAALLLP